MRFLSIIAVLVGVPVIAASQPLPVAEYPFLVETYADFDARPGQISFDDEDNLFAGNFYLAGQDGVPVSVWKISPLDRIPVPFGPPIPDPDVLVVDRNGDLGGVGSVLVGGGDDVYEVPPDGSGASVLFSGGCLSNIQNIVIDELGRLFALSHPSTGVCYIDETIETFVEVGSQVRSLAFGENGEVFVSYDDSVHVYDSEGEILTRGLARGTAIGYCSTGVFQDLLQLMVIRDGDLISIELDTLAETLVLSGIAGGYLAFDSVGDFYLSETSNQRVLRVYLDPTAVAVPDLSEVGNAVLDQNSPNPFNPQTTISFSLTRTEWAIISVFDLTGQRVNVLANREFAAGPHTLTWNGRDAQGRAMPSGTYLVHLETESGVQARKVMLVR